MRQDPVHAALAYLKQNHLLLTTAESCTAGAMVALLAGVPGTGEVLESGYVVYSAHAKQRLLGVDPQTIERFGLTSEAVAWEMARGALRDSQASVAIATTGVVRMAPSAPLIIRALVCSSVVLANDFCTLGHQTTEAYSSLGRSIAVYIHRIILGLRPQV